MTSGVSAYAAFQGAVVVWIRCLGKELGTCGTRGIRGATAAPGLYAPACPERGAARWVGWGGATQVVAGSGRG